MKNKAIKILIIPYITIMILDIYSTLRLKELAPILEVNPLYNLIGFTGLIILNIASVGFFYWAYTTKNTNYLLKYWILCCVFLFILLRIFIVYNNLQWQPDEISIEEAKEIATPQAKQKYFFSILLSYITPIIVCYIPFLLFSLDYKLILK